MAKIVKLTRRRGGVIYLNLDRVLWIMPDDSGSDIFINEDSKHAYQVKETPEEIMKQANN